MKTTKLYLVFIPLLLITSQLFGQNGNLEIAGTIKSDQLAGEEGKILVSDSTGMVKTMDNGGKLTFYDELGRPRLCVRPEMDTTFIEYLDELGEVDISYALSGLNMNNLTQNQRQQNQVFTTIKRKIQYGDISQDQVTTGISNQRTYHRNGIKELEIFEQFPTNSTFVGGTSITFPAENDQTQRRGFGTFPQGTQVFDTETQKSITTLPSQIQVLDFISQLVFTINMISPNGLEFITQDGSLSYFGSLLFSTGLAGLILNLTADLVEVSGDLNVAGTVTSNFQHPSNPNLSVHHAAVQSPHPNTLYKGQITTNQNGIALIQLPEYFSGLNENFTYHLTTPSSFSRARVLRKIEQNTFEIETEDPNVEVHWLVISDCNDISLQRKPFKSVRPKSITVQKRENQKIFIPADQPGQSFFNIDDKDAKPPEN